MITLANIRRAIYNIYKRLDMLEASAGTNPGSGESSGGGFSGDYNDLINKPTIPEAQIQSDWNQTNSSSVDYIKNKPDIYTKSEANGKFVATHDYVEIGGIKWATMNVGADNITDAGLYFQWGDTQGYTSSQMGSNNGKWDGYKYCSSGNYSNLDKYNSTDGKTKLDSSDDAVKAIWGNGWRMPTAEEYAILRDAVNTTWTSNYQGSGVCGRILTDKTDNSKTLFFPAVGEFYDGSLSGNKSLGRYWSTDLYTSNKIKAVCFSFDSSGVLWDFGNWRCSHLTIRAVYDESISYNDLKDKPTIPAAQIQSDWNQSDNTAKDYIKNKPTIPTVPSNETAVSGGSTLSLVTTGEKYTWNNKANIWRGTQAEYDLLTPDDNTIYIIIPAS